MFEGDSVGLAKSNDERVLTALLEEDLVGENATKEDKDGKGEEGSGTVRKKCINMEETDAMIDGDDQTIKDLEKDRIMMVMVMMMVVRRIPSSPTPKVKRLTIRKEMTMGRAVIEAEGTVDRAMIRLNRLS